MAEERLDLRIVRTGREYLGVPRSQLLQWLAEKRITPEDLVRPTGARNWLKVSLAPELLDAPREPSAAAASQSPSGGAVAVASDLGIDIPAKARPRRRGKILEEAAMDMTPMIDVTFQMLIFFMFTNQLANPSPITVPEAEFGRGIDAEGKQTVLIDDQGRYYFGEGTKEENIEPSLDSLILKVAEAAEASDAPLEITISAHKNSKHLGSRELIERLSQLANVGAIRFGVEEKQ